MQNQLTRIEQKLDLVIALLKLDVLIGEANMAQIDDLAVQVTANTDAETSAVTLIEGLAALIKAAGTDPAKLTALQTQLKTSADALAAAIVANTPATPAGPLVPAGQAAA